MKYYIYLVTIVSALIFTFTLTALGRMNDIQEQQLQYIVELQERCQTAERERAQAVAGLIEIQNRIDAVRRFLDD